MNIREFTAADAAAFRTLRLRALQANPEAFGSTAEEFARQGEPSIRNDLARDHASAETLNLGAFIDDVPVGMIGFRRHMRQKRRHKGFIWGVFVLPEHRRCGIAHQLLAGIFEFARNLPELEQITVSVTHENTAAIHFYKLHGFSTYGIEPKAMKADHVYYDEIFMVRFLEGS